MISVNTAKAELHNLIDSLSEYQAKKLAKVVNLFVVEFMVDEQDNEILFEPLQDSDLTDDDRIIIQQAKTEIANGETIPAEQVCREFCI